MKKQKLPIQKKNKISVKLDQLSLDFFKKLKVNIVRAGGSEKSLDLSYADLMTWIVKYNRTDSISYTKMVEEIAKNV